MKYITSILLAVLLFTGCEVPDCNVQECTNGIATFKTCRGNRTIILIDINGEAIRCNTKNKLEEVK